MKKTTSAVGRYVELLELHPPRPIGNAKELRRTQGIVDSMLDRGGLNTDELDYVALLGTLIRAYEEGHEPPLPDLPESAMLAHLIESRGIAQRTVAVSTGIPESTVSDLLSGRRQFNKGHIAKLTAFFQVSPEVFF